MNVTPIGVCDYFFDKFDETISISRPIVNIRHLILSSIYVDLEKDIYAVNHSTGERAEINFIEKGWTCDSYITGTIFDADGK